MASSQQYRSSDFGRRLVKTEYERCFYGDVQCGDSAGCDYGGCGDLFP